MSLDAEPLVELVDASGAPAGVLGKLAAHEPPGRRHRAVSVFLVDPGGDVLIQRRAAGKYHSGGLWSNTCCGHPEPGERPEAAARRRLADELGLRLGPGELDEVGTVDYDIGDPESGLVEREHNHVFVGRVPGPPLPNPAEVDAVATVRLEVLGGSGTGVPGGPDGTPFTAWFEHVLGVARPGLLRLAGPRDEA